MKVVLIAIAGAAGALTRYGLGLAIGARSFPWSTLTINVTGSFLLAFLLTMGVEHGWSEMATVPLAVGFLGAYTTFSTFSFETFTLGRTDRVMAAAVYVVASVAAGVFAAAAGYAVARRIA